ncbi:hypothetical protein PG994_005617 [Apiospora phragmitis]|uniref:Uncharacterized protein n=1 Tax=Apiospora phragmitis TaxID=2905665 RepID=A0ABR1VCQ1_9PEZI
MARQSTLFWPGVLDVQSRRCEYGLLLANKESSAVVRKINKDTKPVSKLVHNQDLFINWDLDLLWFKNKSPQQQNIPEQAIVEWRNAKTALSRMTGLRTLKLVATSVFSRDFDPAPKHPKNALLRQMTSYARHWSPLNASPVGYNRKELRALASHLPRDTHGFINIRLLGPSLRYGIRPLHDNNQFTKGRDLNDYCRELCNLIQYIRYRENHAAWGTLEVGLAVDLDSNFNRSDFPDYYRRVGMRVSSREWYKGPEKFANRN